MALKWPLFQGRVQTCKVLLDFWGVTSVSLHFSGLCYLISHPSPVVQCSRALCAQNIFIIFYCIALKLQYEIVRWRNSGVERLPVAFYNTSVCKLTGFPLIFKDSDRWPNEIRELMTKKVLHCMVCMWMDRGLLGFWRSSDQNQYTSIFLVPSTPSLFFLNIKMSMDHLIANTLIFVVFRVGSSFCIIQPSQHVLSCF